MKRTFKRAVSVVLVLMMIFSSAPISYVAHASGASLGYSAGDIIEFGSYPQSEVTDNAVKELLNKQTLNWSEYSYSDGNGEFGSAKISGYMKYADVEYEGERYRAVIFSKYRPNLTYQSSSAKNSNQDDNGYHTDIVYWFMFEPLQWRVIDPDEGVIICESLIDSQAYTDAVYYYDNNNGMGSDDYYLDSGHKVYANDYESSSVRAWLNDEFYNTAFSDEDKEKIIKYKADNSASDAEYDSDSTKDYVFLPSFDDVTNADFSFSSDSDRLALGTDYAKAQGLYVPESGEGSFWWLRTPGIYSYYACRVSNTGSAGYEGNSVDFCNYGVRPAICYDFDGMGERYTATFMVDDEVFFEKSYAYGESIVLPSEPEKAGYQFIGWFEKNTGASFDGKMPAADTVYEAKWTAGANTKYAIEIYTMNMDGLTYTLDESKSSIKFDGITGTSMTITPDTYEGFSFDADNPENVLSSVINGDGSTVLKAYYSRNKYEITVDGVSAGEFYHGATFTAPSTSTTTEVGYELVSWNNGTYALGEEITVTGPFALTADNKVNANTAYTVETYVMNINGLSYTKSAETKYDMTGRIINYQPIDKTGFTINIKHSVLTGTVTGDGKMAIKVFYDRNTVKVTIDGAEGEYYYGSTIEKEDPTPDTGYTFEKWVDGDGNTVTFPFTVPSDDIVIYPVFEKIPVKLTAKESSGYTVDYDNMAILGVEELTSLNRKFESSFAVEGDGYIELPQYGGYVGTGTVVTLYDNVTGENLGDFTVVVAGDLDGDGVRTGEDSKILYDEILGMTFWSNEYFEEYNLYRSLASDVNEDGMVNSVDFHLNRFGMYTVDKYVMNTEGEYEKETGFSYRGFGVEGGSVSYTPDAAPEGFYLDTAKSVLTDELSLEVDTVLTVYYAREKYKVTFSVDNVTVSQEDYYYGSIIAEPTPPEREGYTFLGWSTDGSTVLEDLGRVAVGGNEFIAVFAVDTVTEYRIKFWLDEAKTIQYGETFTYKYGDSVEFPADPDDETLEDAGINGMFFDFWDGDTIGVINEYTVDYFEEVSSGVYEYNLIAQYSYYEFTVTFTCASPSGGFETTTLEGLYYGDVITADDLPDTTLDGYTLSYWMVGGKKITEWVDYKVTGNVQVLAYFTINTYKAVFNGNGGAWLDENNNPTIESVTLDFCYEDEITAPESDPVREGYYLDPDMPWGTELGYMDIEDVYFDAEWIKEKYTVNWVADGEVIKTETVAYGAALTAPEVNKDGHTVKGWFDAEGNSAPAKMNDIGKNGATVIYTAEFNSASYYIEFYSLIGNAWLDGGNQLFGNTLVTPDAPEEKGYEFLGWFDADGNPMPETVPAIDNQVYYAKYEPIIYKATFDAAGGQFDDGNSTYTYEGIYKSSIVKPANPTKEGYTFSKWSPTVPTKMPASDSTYTAQWEKVEENGTALKIRTEILREVNGEWIPAEKVVAGESVKARVYIDTDYKAGMGQILLFYTNKFFEDSYSVDTMGDLVMNTSPTSSPAAYDLSGTMCKFSPSNRNIQDLITDGYITEEFVNEHSAIAFYFNFPSDANCQYLSGEEWFAEFDLKVREDARGTGDIFVKESTIANSYDCWAFVTVSRQSENSSLAKRADEMYNWDADVTLVSTPVALYSNCVSATFDAGGCTFADGSTIKYFEGEAGAPITVDDPDGGTLYDFAGWSLDGTTVVDEVIFLNEDTTYYAVWKAKAAPEPWWEYSFDETTGELVITGEGELYYTDAWDDLCSDIESVVINDGITAIGESVFENFTNLMNIIIPDSVTSIGAGAFKYCGSLTDVYYSGTEEEWSKISIGSNNSCLTSATIHFEPSDPQASALSFLSTNSAFSLARSTSLPAESVTLNLSDAQVSLEYTEAYYLGEALTPVVYLQYGDELFDAKKELAITYSDNGKIGTAKVLLEGLNRFSGSAELEFTISYEKVPEQIVNVVAIGEIDKISLSWGVSSEVNTKSYNIYRRDEGSDEYSLIKTVNGRDNLSYADTNVEKGKKYIYYVTGVGLYGAESVPSAEVYATVKSDVQVPTISKLTPASGSTINSTATLSVVADDNIGVTKAVYSYSVDDGKTWNDIGEGTASSISVKFDTTVIIATAVKVRVIVYDAENNASEPVINTYKVDNYGPEKVTGIFATAQSSVITLSWNSVADTDFSHFVLQQKINGSWKTVQTNIKTKGANIKNLQAGTEYIFRVAAVDIRGNTGEYSDVITVSTAEDTMIPAITAQSPSPANYKKAFKYSATAQDDCGIASITIQVSSDKKNWSDISTETYTSAATVRTYSCTIETDDYNEGRIYVRAIAKDYSGNESVSDESAPSVQYGIDRTAPSKPVGLKAVGADGYINLEWTVGSEADLGGYYVYRSTSEDGEYTPIMSGKAVYSYPDQTVERDKVYYYKIRVSDICGNMSDYSDIVFAKMTDDTAKPVIRSIGKTYDNKLNSAYNSFAVSASDNNMLSYMVVEYCTTKNMTYTEAARADNIRDAYKNIAVTIPMSGLGNGDKVYVRAYAVDVMGLRSDYVNAQYTVDMAAPSVSDYKVVIAGDTVTLTWKDCGESDLAGFRIYRSENGEDYTSVGSRSVRSSGVYTFTDTVTSSESKTFHYKIEALDNLENSSSLVESVEYIAESEEKINAAPVAKISCKSYMILNVEDIFDASDSSDDSEITEYLWDFGDGTTSSEINPVKKYTAVGTYTVTLTVKDAEGLQNSITQTVEVKEREKLGTLKVRVVDEDGNAMPYFPVHFAMGTSERTVVDTDSNGVAMLMMTEGTYCVGIMAMKVGDTNYLTEKKDVAVLPNATRTVTIVAVEGDVLVGDFEITRLTTVEEIEAVGINPYEMDNSYIIDSSFTLTYGSTPVKINYYRDGDKVVKYTVSDSDSQNKVIAGNNIISPSGEERKIASVTYIGNDTVAILDVPARTQFLQEMFEVKLHITSNASTDFVLKQSEVVLNLPDSGGLSLITNASDTYEKSLAVQLDPIRGQSTVTISWMLKGEFAGDHLLSADFSGIFEEYGEDGWVYRTFEDTIKVYGLSGVTLRMLAADEIHNDTLYFNVELENERDVDLLLPDINIINDKVTNITDKVLGGPNVDNEVFDSTVHLLNIYVQLENGNKQYIPIVHGKNDNLTANLELLAPGQKLVHEYACYNAINYDGIAYFKNAAVSEFDDMKINIETGSFHKILYSFVDHSEKLNNIISSDKNEVIEALNHIKNNKNYYYFYENYFRTGAYEEDIPDEIKLVGSVLAFAFSASSLPGALTVSGGYAIKELIEDTDVNPLNLDDYKDLIELRLLEILSDESINNKVNELVALENYKAVSDCINKAKKSLESMADKAKVAEAFAKIELDIEKYTEVFIVLGRDVFLEALYDDLAYFDLNLNLNKDDIVDFFTVDLDADPFDTISEMCKNVFTATDVILSSVEATNNDAYVQAMLRYQCNDNFAKFFLESLKKELAFDTSISAILICDVCDDFIKYIEQSEEEMRELNDELLGHILVQGTNALVSEAGEFVFEKLITRSLTASAASLVLVGVAIVDYVLNNVVNLDDYIQHQDAMVVHYKLGKAFIGMFDDGVEEYNQETDVKKKSSVAFYTMAMLMALCRIRLNGEAEYKNLMDEYVEGVYIYPRDESKIVEKINKIKNTSYSTLDEWYDDVQFEIVNSRDILFNIESTESNIPSAPEVTLDHEKCETVQSFDKKYEYCFGDGVWKSCNGNPIAFELKTVPQILRVRVAASDNNLAGEVATARILAQKELSRQITVKYDGEKYIFNNLSSKYIYQMEELESRNDEPVWQYPTYITSGVVYGTLSPYVAIRSCPDEELLETYSLPLIIEVQTRHPLDLTITGDGTVEQSSTSGEYFVGDSIDLTATPHEGCEFLGWYINGELVSKDKHYILEFAEDIEVKAEFSGVTVKSIEIESMPTKTVYTVGESLSTDGMKLKVEYSDFSVKTIDSGFTCSESVFAKDGEKTITVSYGGQTAQFTVNVYREYYTLKWVVDGVVTEEHYKFGESVKYPGKTPDKMGYTFEGWSVELPSTMPAQNLTLTAVFAPVSVKIVFDADGGKFADGTSSAEISVDYDSEIPVPEEPERQGYLFAGWSINGENVGTSLGKSDNTDGKTFVAEWIASTDTAYTVETYTMGTNGEYSVDRQIFKGETDSTVKIEPEIDEGFELDSDRSVLEGTIKADNSLVLKVYINRLTYTLTVDYANGSEPVCEKYFYESIVPDIEEPVRYGYDFIGWTPDLPEKMPAEDITVTALYKEKLCNVIFMNGDTVFEVREVLFGSDIPVPASNPEKEGYNFMGWSNDGTVVIENLGKMDETEKIFYAVWHAKELDHVHVPQNVSIPATCTEDGKEYTICLDCDETIGEVVVIPANGHKQGNWEIVEEPTASRDGEKIRKCTVCSEVIERESIPKLSVIRDEDTDIIVEYPADAYNGVLNLVVEESFDGISHTIITTELGLVKRSVYNITLWLNGAEIQPEGKIIIRLPLPEGYNMNRSSVYHVDIGTADIEKINTVYENGYLVFETDHLSYYAIVDDFNGTFEIRNPSVTKIRYGDAIILHADVSETLPEGATIIWEASNSNFDMEVSEDGTTCKITPKSKGDTTFTASVVDANGKVLLSDEQVMTSKAGIFDKIIAFFKKLFGLTKTLPEVFKGIYS